MGSYILINPQASEAERNVAAAINLNGGLAKHRARLRIWVGILILLLVILAFVPEAVVRLFALLAFVPTLAVFLRDNQHAIVPVVRGRWLTTDNAQLIELDAAWRALIAAEIDPTWAAVMDEARFLRVRELARMPHADAAPLIEVSRRRLGEGHAAGSGATPE